MAVHGRPFRTLAIWVLALAMATTFFNLALAQTTAEWMPKGGETLLLEVLDACLECDDLSTLASIERTRLEWRAYFDQFGALGGLTEQEVTTLVGYLEINFPIQGGGSRDTLPMDGSELTLNTCGACHGLIYALVGDLDEQSWMGFLTGNHRGQVDAFGYTEEQVRTLAAYLAANMPVPEEQIPEALLRGAAVY